MPCWKRRNDKGLASEASVPSTGPTCTIWKYEWRKSVFSILSYFASCSVDSAVMYCVAIAISSCLDTAMMICLYMNVTDSKRPIKWNFAVIKQLINLIFPTTTAIENEKKKKKSYKSSNNTHHTSIIRNWHSKYSPYF